MTGQESSREDQGKELFTRMLSPRASKEIELDIARERQSNTQDNSRAVSRDTGEETIGTLALMEVAKTGKKAPSTHTERGMMCKNRQQRMCFHKWNDFKTAAVRERGMIRKASGKMVSDAMWRWYATSGQAIAERREEEKQSCTQLRRQELKATLFRQRGDRRTQSICWSEWLSAIKASQTMIQTCCVDRKRLLCSVPLKSWKGLAAQAQLNTVASILFGRRRSRSSLMRSWDHWLRETHMGLRTAACRYKRLLLVQVILEERLYAYGLALTHVCEVGYT